MQTPLELSSENLLPKDGFVILLENAITQDLISVRDTIAWKHEAIKIFGRKVLQPRLSAWYGDPGTEYVYSGLKNVPLPWNECLLEIKNEVEQLTEYRFNSVLCNLYRHGQDSMGWHQDNEPELGVNPTIASVSLGASRKFSMRHKFDRSVGRLDIELKHGSVLIMSGETQRYWQHQVAKTRKVVGERINLTFRNILPTNTHMEHI